ANRHRNARDPAREPVLLRPAETTPARILGSIDGDLPNAGHTVSSATRLKLANSLAASGRRVFPIARATPLPRVHSERRPYAHGSSPAMFGAAAIFIMIPPGAAGV